MLGIGLVFFFLVWVVNASTFDFFSRFPVVENGGMNFFSVSEQLLLSFSPLKSYLSYLEECIHGFLYRRSQRLVKLVLQSHV